jgi:hypothetical protein
LALGDHDAKVNSVRSCLKQLTISWVAAIALAATPATAADDIGEALAVIDQASTEGTVGNQKLSVGMKVLLGDRVITDSAGEAQLLFNDGWSGQTPNLC